MKRVLVIGCPGSGKSTFARALHQRTELPLFYLDMMNWNPDRTTVERSVFRARLSAVLEQPKWIIDGNYASTMEWRMQHCDTVFFLDYPQEICLDGIRLRRGKARPDMPWTESETEEDAEFLAFVRNYRFQERPNVLALLNKSAGKEIHIFENRQQAEAFLTQLCARTD